MKAMCLVVGMACAGFCGGACKQPLSPDDLEGVGSDIRALETCKQEGRDCKKDGGTPEACFEVYKRCTDDAGLR